MAIVTGADWTKVQSASLIGSSFFADFITSCLSDRRHNKRFFCFFFLSRMCQPMYVCA